MIADMMDALGINSPNGMKCHLDALRKKRCIDWVEGIARSVGVTGTARSGIPLIDLEDITIA